MLIVISAIASAVALFGALIVGYSTSQTIKGMAPKRDPNSLLVAFPADVEQQIKQQQTTSSGVAVLQPNPEREVQQQAAALRDSISRAAGQAVSAPGEVSEPGLQQLAGKLESVLLSDDKAGADIGALRDYALRQLTAQDGGIVLPRYDISGLDLAGSGLHGELVAQLANLQAQLSQQIAALPELQHRQLKLQDIRLSGNLRQLEAAIEALGLQADLLGLDIDSGARYQSLQALGEELLGGASLDGLDLGELEAVSRELLSQLGGDIDL